MQPAKALVSALVEMPMPETPKRCHTLLGAVGFFRDFMSNAEDLFARLQHLVGLTEYAREFSAGDRRIMRHSSGC